MRKCEQLECVALILIIKAESMGKFVFNSLLKLVLIVFSFFVFATVNTTVSYAAELTLAWDANTESDLKGYVVYYGSGSRNYDHSIDVGNVTTYTILDLAEGQTYYLAATAYDTGLNESAYSEEISYTIPISAQSYSITAAAGSNGQIAPSGTISVREGDSRDFTIIPDSGYDIADVRVDGQSVGALSTYTFSNVSSDHSIAATFVAQVVSYSITATAGSYGQIAPSGTISVTEGDSRDFMIIPDSGYAIADVRVDGQSVGALSSYTFSNVTADHSIVTTFVGVNVNRAPDPPDLLYPQDAAGDASMTPLLELSGYSDPDPGDAHGATRWQVAADSSFNQLILDITCDAVSLNGCLMNLFVGQGTLSGVRLYFWRAKVKDDRQIDSKWSDWSDPYHFTTGVPAYVDGNDNGVPDDIEPLFSDFDDDGNNDNDQPLMRVFEHSSSGVLAGIKAIEGVDHIDYFSHIDPSGMPEYNKPDHLPYGMMNFKLRVNEVGGTARIEIIFSAVVDNQAGWYKFDPLNGWYKFPVASESGKYYLEISDGGDGDIDGVANGIIVDPIGIASTGDSSADTSLNSASGGGGCFIHTSTAGRNGYLWLIVILAGALFICSMPRFVKKSGEID